MTTLSENIISAIKGRHKNQPNLVQDSKLVDIERVLKNIKDEGILGNSTGTSFMNAKHPYPPRIMPNETNDWLRHVDHEMRYKAIDKEQNVYATTAHILKKLPIETAITSTSIADWTTVWEPDTLETGQINVSAVMVTATNRVIACTQKGFVYVSDENQTNFADSGIRMHESGGIQSYTHTQFGYGQYESLVWVSSYGEAPSLANRAFLSKDYGATFVAMTEIPYVLGTQNTHIHDIQYDPYADRFWVVIGDQDNCNIHYSDDMGVTWKAVFGKFSEDVRNTQLTSIACYPHGVVFGSDHAVSDLNSFTNNHMEDCIRYWKRPKGERQSFVDPDSIEIIYSLYEDNTFRSFAMKSWQGRVGENILTLMPWYGIGDNKTLLTASIDGLNWCEIYRGEYSGGWQLAGVDDKNRIIGFDRNKEGKICMLAMPLPDWI